MMGALLQILQMLWKDAVPSISASPEAQYLHRLRVTLVACTAFLGLLASMALAYGVLPWFDGFARASDVRYIRVHMLDDSLLELRINNCRAPTPEARQEYYRRIEVLKDEYLALTRIPYALPNCADL
jgi:hypothetical protein